MKTSIVSDHHLHLGHLFQVGVLNNRAQDKNLSKATRHEAAAELLRYRDESLSAQRYKEVVHMAKKSRVHDEPQVFSGQGIVFAVIDDREAMPEGSTSTIGILTEGIEAALDAGHEDSESIARFLTTSAFQHVTDKRIRFNSVLKAGDVVGARITQKLHNAYNDLITAAEYTESTNDKATVKAEARGFAEALMIVLSPFSSEASEDPRLVNWDEVDRMADAFEKEQRFVIKERKGKIQ